MGKYYGFEYASGKKTTSGSANETTGRLNTAGNLIFFIKKENRDDWVDETGRSTQKTREAVSVKKTRNLHLGMSVADYEEMLSDMEPLDIDDCSDITIKNVREKINLTQKQMAALLGMSQQGVGRIETGYDGRSETRQIQYHLAAIEVIFDAGLLDTLTEKTEAI